MDTLPDFAGRYDCERSQSQKQKEKHAAILPSFICRSAILPDSTANLNCESALKITTFATLPTLCLLAACGGGGGGPVTSGPLSVDEVGLLVTDIGDDIANEVAANNFTPASAVPMSSTFKYDGFIAIGQTVTKPNDPTQAIGTVDLTIDLAANTVSGSATNFYDQSATPMIGTIPLAGGTLVRSNLGVAAPSIQNLQFQSGGSNLLTRDGNPWAWGQITMEGGIYGANADLVSASGTTNVIVDGNSVEITAAIGAEK